jgi:S-methylmethionine-dependent homocysteine/selenocysteine methylase
MEAVEDYFTEQLGWPAATEAEMVTALTFNQAGDAAGLVRAARTAGLPVVVSFTVETNGALPTGQSLSEAINQVDENTDGFPSYLTINCANPDHFAGVCGTLPGRGEFDVSGPTHLAEVTPSLTQRRNWIRETQRN